MWYIATMEYYQATKKEWIIDTHYNLDESQNHYLGSKKPGKKEYIFVIPIL